MSVKMPIYSSNLALRFHVADGWTKELLETFVTKGKIVPCTGFDDEKDERLRYYLPDVYTTMNVDNLMEHISTVNRRFNDYPHETDKEFIARMLW